MKDDGRDICTEVPIRTVKTCVPTSFSLALPNPYDRETCFFVETLLVCGSTAIAKRSRKVPNDACLWHHGTKVPKFGSSREGKICQELHQCNWWGSLSPLVPDFSFN